MYWFYLGEICETCRPVKITLKTNRGQCIGRITTNCVYMYLLKASWLAVLNLSSEHQGSISVYELWKIGEPWGSDGKWKRIIKNDNKKKNAGNCSNGCDVFWHANEGIFQKIVSLMNLILRYWVTHWKLCFICHRNTALVGLIYRFR